ncbi:hypothetical protein [Runella sp.]|uniref:hypothetical protein n=1 Tax=Runella sp. TaxID=1960881 RepID=UPI003D099B39
MEEQDLEITISQKVEGIDRKIILDGGFFSCVLQVFLKKIITGDIEVTELKQHYYKKFEVEAKAQEFKTMVSH